MKSVLHLVSNQFNYSRLTTGFHFSRLSRKERDGRKRQQRRCVFVELTFINYVVDVSSLLLIPCVLENCLRLTKYTKLFMENGYVHTWAKAQNTSPSGYCHRTGVFGAPKKKIIFMRHSIDTRCNSIRIFNLRISLNLFAIKLDTNLHMPTYWTRYTYIIDFVDFSPFLFNFG